MDILNTVIEYRAAILLLILVCIGTIIYEILLPFTRGKGPDGKIQQPAISIIAQNSLKDTISVVAFVITAATIIMILVKETIHPVLEKSFFIILGYYFGKEGSRKTD